MNKSFKVYFENYSEDFSLKYENWKLGDGYSKGFPSWNLYKNKSLVCSVSNDTKDKNNIVIRHIESKEKGMATKLIFMLLDKGVKIDTGKPNYNSISTSAYYMFKKIINLINNNPNYRFTILGKANNEGKENYDPYKESSIKDDNFHYRFEKIINK